MTKTHINLTIDTYIKEICVAKRINMSGECERYLRSLIEIEDGKIGEMDLALIRVQKERLKARLANDTVELKSLETKERRIVDVNQTKMVKFMQREKQLQKEEERCLACNFTFHGKKTMRTKAGKVCLDCYHLASKRQRTIWNNPKK